MAEPETPHPGALAAYRLEPYTVLVPYVEGRLSERTRDAVAEWGGYHILSALDPMDATGYARLLMQAWGDKLNLVLVGQTIVPAPGMIADLLACSAPWCAHAYYIGGGYHTTGLGLCKISGAVMAEHPVLASLAVAEADETGRGLGPHELGRALERRLLLSGCWQHEHAGAPVNLAHPRPGVDGG